MVEARREFTWQVVHKQTLDIINSFRTARQQLKTLGYPYCNIVKKADRPATQAENEEWLRRLASSYNLTITEEKKHGRRRKSNRNRKGRNHRHEGENR